MTPAPLAVKAPPLVCAVQSKLAIVKVPAPRKVKGLLSTALPNSSRSVALVSLRMLFGPSSLITKSDPFPYWIVPAPLKSIVAAPRLRAVVPVAEIMVSVAAIVKVLLPESKVKVAPVEETVKAPLAVRMVEVPIDTVPAVSLMVDSSILVPVVNLASLLAVAVPVVVTFPPPAGACQSGTPALTVRTSPPPPILSF